MSSVNKKIINQSIQNLKIQQSDLNEMFNQEKNISSIEKSMTNEIFNASSQQMFSSMDQNITKDVGFQKIDQNQEEGKPDFLNEILNDKQINQEQNLIYEEEDDNLDEILQLIQDNESHEIENNNQIIEIENKHENQHYQQFDFQQQQKEQIQNLNKNQNQLFSSIKPIQKNNQNANNSTVQIKQQEKLEKNYQIENNNQIIEIQNKYENQQNKKFDFQQQQKEQIQNLNQNQKQLFSSIKPIQTNNQNANNPTVQIKQQEKLEKNYQIADVQYWNDTEFQWENKVQYSLQNTFGFKNFKNNQKAVINCLLSGNDVLAVMPTGGGKSVTFHLPADISNGVTIVIMPLISLIYDQVSQLEGLGIKSYKMVGTTNFDELNQIKGNCFSQTQIERTKIIFITPEKLNSSENFKKFLKTLHQRKKLDRFVIDEAHCVYQWGNDFRNDYLKLSFLKQEFPDVPMIALTATATDKIKIDIINLLNMKNPYYFQSSFNRPNLFYEVLEKNKKNVLEDMANFINSKYKNKSGIIYCSTKKECEQISEKLNTTYNLKTKFYHSEVEEKEKNKIQDDWMQDEIQIIVATIAFGMGINKSDVRFIIHYTFSKSIENYQQESGRAGRDGKDSHCLIYYSSGDKQCLEHLISSNEQTTAENKKENLYQLNQIIKYCEDKVTCRREIQLKYFGQIFDGRKSCGKNCDNCLKGNIMEEKECKKEALQILKFVHQLNGKITQIQLIKALKGNKIQIKNVKLLKQIENSPTYGFLKDWEKDPAETLVKTLIQSEFIGQTLNFYNGYSFMVILVDPVKLKGFEQLNEFKIYFQKKDAKKQKIIFKNNVKTDSEQKDEDNQSFDLDEQEFQFSEIKKKTITIVQPQTTTKKKQQNNDYFQEENQNENNKNQIVSPKKSEVISGLQTPEKFQFFIDKKKNLFQDFVSSINKQIDKESPQKNNIREYNISIENTSELLQQKQIQTPEKQINTIEVENIKQDQNDNQQIQNIHYLDNFVYNQSHVNKQNIHKSDNLSFQQNNSEKSKKIQISLDELKQYAENQNKKLYHQQFGYCQNQEIFDEILQDFKNFRKKHYIQYKKIETETKKNIETFIPIRVLDELTRNMPEEQTDLEVLKIPIETLKIINSNQEQLFDLTQKLIKKWKIDKQSFIKFEYEDEDYSLCTYEITKKNNKRLENKKIVKQSNMLKRPRDQAGSIQNNNE